MPYFDPLEDDVLPETAAVSESYQLSTPQKSLQYSD